MIMNDYCVYIHTSPSNKRYIGITSQKPERRWRNNGNGYSDSPVFFNAIKRYGWDNFNHEIMLSGLSYEEAEMYEVMFIRLFRSTDRRYGYNMESGGTSGKRLSELTKQKLSIANAGKGNPDALRKWILNNGPWNKGTKGLTSHTDDWKKNMSQKMSGKNNPAYGKDYSNKRNYAEENHPKGKDHWHATLIKQYDKEGNYIRTFETITAVAHALGKNTAYDVSNVVACARGRRKTAYGYVWKYA